MVCLAVVGDGVVVEIAVDGFVGPVCVVGVGVVLMVGYAIFRKCIRRTDVLIFAVQRGADLFQDSSVHWTIKGPSAVF